MKNLWFKKVWGGWLEWPITWQGWAVMTIWILANIAGFIRVDRLSHSVSDTLIGFAPLFILSSLLLILLTRFTSE